MLRSEVPWRKLIRPRRRPAAVEPLTREEAFVGVAMCAAYADGSMAAEESDEFADQLASVRALQGLDEPALRQALLKVDRIARKEGDAALLAQAAAALPADLRPTAFYLGVDLVLADDELASEERGFVEALRKALQVPEDVAARIVDVVLLKNRA